MKYPNKYFKVKTCKTCSAAFTPKAPSQMYCSTKCRGKTAYYERNYGITETEYRQMLVDQDQKCHLCGSEGFLIGNNNHSERLAVDHCHSTGKVRKLLCHNCNRALGLMKDNPVLLRLAADYVERDW